MIDLRVALGCEPTAKILAELLRERGLEFPGRLRIRRDEQGRRRVMVEDGEADAIVSWGVRLTDENKPTLNRNAGSMTKFDQLRTLQQAGVLTVPFYARTAVPGNQVDYPLLARKFQHVGGSDIRIVLQPEDAIAVSSQNYDYFTKYLPRLEEYRTWIYRRQHLGTYRKQLTNRESFIRIGANYDNGFTFNIVPVLELPEPIVTLAVQAVEALGLDFGAVDILQAKADRRYYALEVNTAPGVEGPDRQVIQGLASKIARWAELGYPKRRGDGNRYKRIGCKIRWNTSTAV